MKVSTVKAFLIGDILPHCACAKKINDVAKDNPAYAFNRELQRQEEVASGQLSLGRNVFYDRASSASNLDDWYSGFDKGTTKKLAQLLYCHEVDILEDREPFKGLDITSTEASDLAEIFLALSMEPVPQMLELPELVLRDGAEVPIHVIRDPSMVFRTIDFFRNLKTGLAK